MSITGDADLVPAYIGTMLTLCVISVLLNILAIIVIYKFGRAQTSVEILLTNLAVSDILHAGVVLPIHFKNVSTNHKDFYGGDDVCRLIMFIPLLTIMSAISTIVAIAIDRYRTMLLHKSLNRKYAIVTVVIIWIVSFVTSSPQLYEYIVYDRYDDEYDRVFKSCGSEGIPENFETIYASIVLVVSCLAPLLILIACYTRILIYIWHNARRLRAGRSDANVEGHRDSDSMMARKIMVVKLSILITASFAIYWSPFFILFTLTEVSGTDDTADFGEWPHLVGRAMTVLSTISNPLIYLFFNASVRRQLRRLPCFRKMTATEDTILASVVSRRNVKPSNDGDPERDSGKRFRSLSGNNKIHVELQSSSHV